MLFNRLFAHLGIKTILFEKIKAAGQSVGQIFLDIRGDGRPVCNDLLGGVFPKLVDYFGVDALSRKLGQLKLAGGRIHKRNGGGSVIFSIKGGKEIIFSFLKQQSFDGGTRGHDPDDTAVDKSLCLGRVLGLLAYSDLIALSHKSCNISLTAMIGHSAHRCFFLLPAGLLGEGQFKLLRDKLGIVEKHFVEVSQSEKENGSGIFFFDF